MAVRYCALDHSEPARTERRIARLLSWYPPQWRVRYGEEFAELLGQTIRDGHGGPRLTLNVIREGDAAWLATNRRGLIAIACWSLCWLPLVSQGLVALALKLTPGTHRSWFVALYLPGALQWPMIAAMLSTGLLMLATAVRTEPALRPPQYDAERSERPTRGVARLTKLGRADRGTLASALEPPAGRSAPT